MAVKTRQTTKKLIGGSKFDFQFGKIINAVKFNQAPANKPYINIIF